MVSEVGKCLLKITVEYYEKVETFQEQVLNISSAWNTCLAIPIKLAKFSILGKNQKLEYLLLCGIGWVQNTKDGYGW